MYSVILPLYLYGMYAECAVLCITCGKHGNAHIILNAESASMSSLLQKYGGHTHL